MKTEGPSRLRRTPWPVVLVHWLLVVSVLVSLLSGLRIAADAPDSGVTATIAPWMPQGAVLVWHVVASMVFTGLTIGYLTFLIASGRGARILPSRRWLSLIANGGLSRWTVINWGLYWVVFGLFAVAFATGAMQYLRFHGLPLGLLEDIHRAAAWGFILFTIAHVLAQFVFGWRRIVGIFIPSRYRVGAAISAFAAAAVASAGLWTIDQSALQTLQVVRISEPPRLDGVGDDPAWALAPATRVLTTGGANLPGGESTVVIRAVRDDEYVWMLFEWDDSTRSQKHLPLVKTTDGWQILQQGYLDGDESTYYEDKFAVLLAESDPKAALQSIHLGSRPIADARGPLGGRGLHYMDDDRILDLWHWWSVRGNALGQAEDGFFGPPRPMPSAAGLDYTATGSGDEPGRDRYKGGYYKDPPMTWSSWEMNWQAPGRTQVTPRRLPEELEDVASLANADLRPGISDPDQWWIDHADTIPYTAAADTLPVGAVLPGVLLHEPAVGDRGDVKARGRWHQGSWHLEIRRQLDTGSDYDVPLTDGTLMWVAVFDQTQTRHSMHLRPIRIALH